MHPLLIQQLAKLHMEELQREATTTRFANSAGVSSGNTTVTVTNLKQMRQGNLLPQQDLQDTIPSSLFAPTIKTLGDG